MDIHEAKNDIERYDEALESTPANVREFLWSDGFTAIIDATAKMFTLDDTQKEAVRSTLFGITIGYVDEPGARSALTQAGIGEDVQDSIFEIAEEYLVAPATGASEAMFDELKNETMASPEGEERDKVLVEKNDSLPGNDILKDLQERLHTSATIAPTKRDVSLDNKPNTPSQPRSIDPYREIPE